MFGCVFNGIALSEINNTKLSFVVGGKLHVSLKKYIYIKKHVSLLWRSCPLVDVQY